MLPRRDEFEGYVRGYQFAAERRKADRPQAVESFQGRRASIAAATEASKAIPRNN